MLSFLFWNLNDKPLTDRVARLVEHLDVDFIMLAECSIAVEELLGALNGSARPGYSCPRSAGRKILILTRLPTSTVTDRFNSPRMTIRTIDREPGKGLILVAVHFQSLGQWSRDDQTLQATQMAQEIVRVEEEFGHRRTILVGDLNMNPFDPGVVAAQGIHAVMTRALAWRGERTVAGRTYPFFYNPMWGHFGDRTPGPPGTYYLHAAKPENHFWHMYDQVLLRPYLMDHLADLRILDNDGKESLVSRHGRPNRTQASDHLPLFFVLDV